MKHIIWIFVLGFGLQPLLMQGQIPAAVQGLMDSLSHTTDQEIQVEVMNEIAWEYRNDNPEQGLKWAQQAQELARKLVYPKGLGDSHLRQALLHFKQGNNVEALSHANQSVEIRRTGPDPIALGGGYLMVANIQVEMGEWEDAETTYQKAIEQYELGGREVLKLKAYNGQAISANRQNKPEKALSYYRKALSLFHAYQLRDTIALVKLLRNTGVVYFEQAQLDSAWFYFEAADNRLHQFSQEVPLEAVANTLNLGNVLMERGSPDLALNRYYRSALALAKAQDFGDILPELLLNVSQAYEQLGHPDSALPLLKELRELDFQQYNAAVQDTTQRLSGEFKLSEANYQLEIANVKLQLRTLYIFLALAVALILLIIVLVNRRLSHQREERLKSELLGTIQQKNLHFMAELNSGMEREYKRIGHDLHNSLLSLLGFAKINLSALEKTVQSMEEEPRRQLEIAQETLESAIEKTRDLSRAMAKGMLNGMGLYRALERLKDIIEATGEYRVNLNCADLSTIQGSENESLALQLIQELVNNALRHADPTEIDIHAFLDAGKLVVMVEDNGKGFPAKWMSPEEGIGLDYMKAKVEDFAVDSQPGQGASISFSLVV